MEVKGRRKEEKQREVKERRKEGKQRKKRIKMSM